MVDLIREFRCAQEEFEVLNAIVSGVESTGGSDQRTPDTQKMPDVHHSAEELRRPIRFMKRSLRRPASSILSESV